LRASRLKEFSPHSWVEVSQDDAKHLGLGDGDPVKVVSPVGESTTKVRVTGSLPSGLLFMPISFPDSPVNELFDIKLDPRSKAPFLKSCAVRVERIKP
jgi:predicted molibdopterin-dependent oxidoreductase YjgC